MYVVRTRNKFNSNLRRGTSHIPGTGGGEPGGKGGSLSKSSLSNWGGGGCEGAGPFGRGGEFSCETVAVSNVPKNIFKYNIIHKNVYKVNTLPPGTNGLKLKFWLGKLWNPC